MIDQDRILKIDIKQEMQSAYIDYSMSVIVARALPDVRDGFKPVHRRVLFGMDKLGNTSDKRGGYSHLSNISVITFSLRKDKFRIDLRRQDT